jgi:hypothetical protein
LGIGDWGLGPIPNPQSPIPNPQSPIPNEILILISFLIKLIKNKKLFFINILFIIITNLINIYYIEKISFFHTNKNKLQYEIN